MAQWLSFFSFFSASFRLLFGFFLAALKLFNVDITEEDDDGAALFDRVNVFYKPMGIIVYGCARLCLVVESFVNLLRRGFR